MYFAFNFCKQSNLKALWLLAIMISIFGFNSHALGKIDPPVFSVERGFCEANFDLTISTSIPAVGIKYTLDCSDPRFSPTARSAQAPLTLVINPESTDGRGKTPAVVVRAYAYKNGLVDSDVMTHTYIFIEKVKTQDYPGGDWPKQAIKGQIFDYEMDPEVVNHSHYRHLIDDALLDIPSISLATDIAYWFAPDSGIFVNSRERGREWEKPTSVELIDPDGRPGFQVNAGVRIRGGYSRQGENPKHAFRLFFRKDYGPGKLDFPLFEDEGLDEFDNVDLRTAQNYSWSFHGDGRNTFVRDVFSRDTQGAMGQPYTRSRYYHLYLNGLYWGLFQTQERSEASFAASYLGGQPENYDVVKVDMTRGYVIEATDGTLDAWRQVWEFCNTGFATDEIYYQVQGLNPDGTRNQNYPRLVDIDNLIDYMLCTFFVGDFDGPISNFLGNNSPNNFYAVYNRNGQDGFKFFRHDAEHTLMDRDWGYDRTGPFPAGQNFQHFNPQWLHQQLVVHPEYRLRLADRAYQHFFNEGALTRKASVNRILARKEQIDLAIIAESARWGDAKSGNPLTRDQHWLPEINFIVNDYLQDRGEIVLNQLIQKGWYPRIDPPSFNQVSGPVSKGTLLRIQAPSGAIYYTSDGSDPHSPFISGGQTSITLLAETAVKRVVVPGERINNRWRTDLNFNDSDWQICSGSPGGIGYEKNSGYENEISLDVSARMFNGGDNPTANTSCFIRIPFEVSQEALNRFNFLKVKIQYDDGFVIYLNGKIVAQINAPNSVQWNSTATQNHEADQTEIFDISADIDLLKAGPNLLAIHGLNVSTESSDFLIRVAFIAGNSSITGGGVAPNARLYSSPLTIQETTSFKARVFDQNQWSTLSEITLWVLPGLENLKITEIHYHPLGQGPDDAEDNEFEFIELKNIGTALLDLSGVYFSEGINFQFPDRTYLPAGGFIVLAANPAKFKERYEFSPHAQYSGKLDNGGERLALNNANHDTLIQFRYNDKFPWPRSADGDGYSLVPRHLNPCLPPNEPANWRASANLHGSPGADDLATPIIQRTSGTPRDFQLFQNYPNPFNAVTSIRFTVDEFSPITLTIYNLLGEEVATLVDDKLVPGEYAIQWDASQVASGIYFYQLHGPQFRRVRKLVLVK